jgi:hypothetical protein
MQALPVLRPICICQGSLHVPQIWKLGGVGWRADSEIPARGRAAVLEVLEVLEVLGAWRPRHTSALEFIASSGPWADWPLSSFAVGLRGEWGPTKRWSTNQRATLLRYFHAPGTLPHDTPLES